MIGQMFNSTLVLLAVVIAQFSSYTQDKNHDNVLVLNKRKDKTNCLEHKDHINWWTIDKI